MNGRLTRLARRCAGAAATLVLALCLLSPRPASADTCLRDVWYNGDAPGRFIFPNWGKVYMGTYTLWLFVDGTGTLEQITGITMVNYGTATAADIKGLYVRLYCNPTGPDPDTGTLTMSYQGPYPEDSGTYPAWTWTGLTPDFSNCPDLCGDPVCGAALTLYVYADIAACPTPWANVNLGFPSHELSSTSLPGSIYDDAWGCAVPWYEADINRGADEDTIVWAYKDADRADPVSAAPADTITYTIYYGKPGTNNLSSIVVTDTLPNYTHYIQGTGSVAPDPGWDPDIGPPQRLRWTVTTDLTVAGGPTNSITYQVSVDWGNGESFEPGSGDIGAPEGQPLVNRAQMSWQGTTCGIKGLTTDPISTPVRRFLFWKLGDNDVLFASALGQPPDEMIYSIFMKNLSARKTWWDVRIWDTVPAYLEVWNQDCGFEDPCTGWTMTPSGCAAASPASYLNAAKGTVLTWRLDMPPYMTLTLRWKSQVKPTAPSGSTAINQVAIKGLGRVNVVDGTGDTGPVQYFTHLAMIFLRTTYISYVGFGAATNNRTCPGFFIDFFPLNKQTQFELRGIQYGGAGTWADVGGKSQSIGCLIGDCINGFPGDSLCTLGAGVTAIPGGGYAGCKVERIPAVYNPTIWALPNDDCGAFQWPFNFIYKLTSNSPVVWQILTHFTSCNQDRHTMAPATTLTYAGYLAYTWRGDFADGASLTIINTGMPPSGTFNANLRTTVHLFRYEYTTNDWLYMSTYSIGGHSQVSEILSCPGNTQPCADTAPWRIMSSDTQIIVDVGEYEFNTAGCCCCSGADNHGTFAPTRETGLVVGKAGSHFYGVVGPQGCGSNMSMVLLGSTGGAGTYTIWRYTPDTNIGSARIPALLRGTSGFWMPAMANVNLAAAGFGPGAPPDPNVGPPNTVDLYNAAPFKRGGNNLFMVELNSGGPIQVLCGTDLFAQWGGGAVIHEADGTAPAGSTFWHHQTGGRNTCYTLVVQWFTPKTVQSINAVSNDGYSARYTTDGTDQCIAFTRLTCPDKGIKRSTRFEQLTGGAMMGLYQQTQITEKGYTASFLSSGTHYQIVAPQTAYIGQNFWITIIVTSTLGGTETDYCGTTSFTSTDPAAKIMGTPMDTTNYTWKSGVTPCGSSPFDNGVKIFFNVTFSDIGLQTIVASDTADGSITGLASIMVVGADIRLWKEPKLSVMATGDTVKFKVCWSNYSSASAFTFVVTDAVPNGTDFIPEAGITALDCGSTDGVAMSVSYSTLSTGVVPQAASFTTANPVSGTRWLRWTMFVAGVQTTGCACYRIKIQ